MVPVPCSELYVLLDINRKITRVLTQPGGLELVPVYVPNNTHAG